MYEPHEKAFILAVVKAIDEAPTAEAAAKAIDKLCRAEAASIGQKPDIECALHSPVQIVEYLDGYEGRNAWWVVWEAGYYDWAVAASLNRQNWANRLLAEPYYGFDLVITEE